MYVIVVLAIAIVITSPNCDWQKLLFAFWEKDFEQITEILLTLADILLIDSSILYTLKRLEFYYRWMEGASDKIPQREGNLHRQALWSTVRDTVSFCKQELGPVACLDADIKYPNYKRSLLALLYDTHDVPVDVKQAIWPLTTPLTEDELSTNDFESLFVKASREVYSDVHNSVLHDLGVEDATLANVLRYLCLVNNLYRAFGGLEHPCDLPEQLLTSERLSYPLAVRPARSSTFSAQDADFISSKLQVPPENAVCALQHSNGSLSHAMRLEISCMRLNRSLLQQLALEYGRSRGLVMELRAPWLQMMHYSTVDDPEVWNVYASIRAALEEHDIATVMGLCVSIHSNFVVDFPDLVFSLRSIEVLCALQDKDIEEAMRILRVDLCPIVESAPDMRKALKNLTWVMLMEEEEADEEFGSRIEAPSGKCGCSLELLESLTEILSSDLICALSDQRGDNVSRLGVLFRTLLSVHDKVYDSAGNIDTAGPFFDIPEMKGQVTSRVSSPLRERSTSPTMSDAPVQEMRGSLPTDTDVSSHEQSVSETSDEESPLIDEASIQTLMEAMALPRADAIEILERFEGDIVEAVASMLQWD